ncbi:MAG: hypothetical protein IPO77_11375 [Acidobacteria bacterium]|nr:hypothetical protein [Acidobacteriota bacterium]
MQYISSQSQQSLSQSYRLTSIVVMSFCFTVIMFMGVARFIEPNQTIPGSEKWGKTIYTVVIVVGLSIVGLRRFFMSQSFLGRASQKGPDSVLSVLQKMTIIICAIAEAVGISGLIFYRLTGDYQYSWRLGVVAILLILYSFPRRGEWERAVAESEKHGTP